MGVTGEIKQISTSSLNLFIKDPYLVELFFYAHLVPESAFWERVPYWSGEATEKTKQNAIARFWSKFPGRNKESKSTLTLFDITVY